jgi:hypothetical protein
LQYIENFGDGRQGAWCIHCGGAAKGSRDHMPSRVFLDKPYPENLPQVDVCVSCNQSFSLNEEYLACFLECVVCGTTHPDRLVRPKIRRILDRTTSLRARIERGKREAKTIGRDDLIVWRPEERRVQNVILKLARGHAFFELNEPMLDQPTRLLTTPLHLLADEDRGKFEASALEDFPIAPWPEVGSRAMQRLASGADMVDGWVVVQPGRYRYQAIAAGFVSVKMVLRDYLAAEVIWDS